MKRSKAPHTSCQRGKRVRIITKDNQTIEGKFLERTGNFIILDTGKVKSGSILKFYIIR